MAILELSSSSVHQVCQKQNGKNANPVRSPRRHELGQKKYARIFGFARNNNRQGYSTGSGKTELAPEKVETMEGLAPFFTWTLDVPPSVAAATYGETSERLPRRLACRAVV
jgi:hypothetical protein